jgi:polysaccharide chain length determinant protein (PEP-CTERM system associated)
MVLVPFVICAVGAVVASKRLPDRYRSETLIMLVPQRIPDSYVRPTVTTKIEDRLTTLQEQILSRSRLERIILDLDLYQLERSRLPMEDVVQRMRDEISVKIEGKESFQVSYVNRDAKTAQQATERLASLFIEENLRDRENVAVDTNQFLESQLQDARRHLVEQEKKLEEYRRRYSGQLPTQATSNLQAIQSAQLQLQSVGDALDRARERRLLIERQLADLQTPDPVAIIVPPAPGQQENGAQGESTAQQLAAARTRLQGLLLKDKPDHPDVKMLQRTIRDLEAKQAAEEKDAASSEPHTEKTITPTEATRLRRIRDLKDQLEDLDRQLGDRQQQEKRLREVIAEYQAKLDAVPSRESDLVELTRDYTTLQSSYQSLLTKKEESKLAANLERRNIGEQFKVLDPARVPVRPFSPNRRLIAIGGSAAGLAIGVLLIVLLEYLDSSLKTEEDVVRLCQLPVLALVPIMTSREEQRRASRRRTATVSVVTAAVILASAVALIVWRANLL